MLVFVPQKNKKIMLVFIHFLPKFFSVSLGCFSLFGAKIWAQISNLVTRPVGLEYPPPKKKKKPLIKPSGNGSFMVFYIVN